MKILYVDQTGQLGGGELSLLDWLSRSSKGARVALFEDGPLRPLLEELGIPVEVLTLGALKTIRRESGLATVFCALPALIVLRQKLSEAAANADILYANSQKAFFLTAIAKRSRQPLVWHLRDLLTAEHFSSLLRRIAIFAGHHFATVILVNSQATADAFIAAGGRPDKLRMVPDGVDSAPFDAVDHTVISALHQQFCPPGNLLIGLFGRLAHWKGQHILLEAIAQMPGFQVCLVGDALFGEQLYAESLRKRAAKPDLAGRVHFCGFRTDIPALMRAMDIVVHTSIAAEPLGRVIIEGMLARRPVIATRAGGAMEIATDGETGLLVTPGSVEELRDALRSLHEDSELRARLANAGRAHAEKAYSLSIMVERVNSVLQELQTSA
jgi:glycosyltransferase involved in cell wall biosynthesis